MTISYFVFIGMQILENIRYFLTSTKSES